MRNWLIMEHSNTHWQQTMFCPKPLTRTSKLSLPSTKPDHPKSITLPISEYCLSNKHSLQCQARYLQNVAGDLHFSKEVVKDRGLPSLPYKEWDSKGIYSSCGVSTARNRTVLKLQPKHHKIFLLNPSVLKEKKPKQWPVFGSGLWREGDRESVARTVSSSTSKKQSKLIKKVSDPALVRLREQPKEGLPSEPNKLNCNSHDILLKMLTKTTAEWILAHHIGHKAAKQQHCLDKSTELIREEHMTEADFTMYGDLKESKIQKKQVFMEDNRPTTSLPVYNKMPRYVTSTTGVKEDGGQNKTSVVNHLEPTPPLKSKTPKARKYVYYTDNEFKKELYSGSSKIIHQKDIKKKDHILMESQNQYKKHVQDSLPRSYHEWGIADENTALRPEKGLRRWLALPTAAVTDLDSFSHQTSAPEESGSGTKETQCGSWSDKHVLRNILSQWKSAWLISTSWKNYTLEQLTNDLAGVHQTCKVSALMTIASSAVAGPLVGIDPRKMNAKENEKIHSKGITASPSEVLNLVSDALHDEDSLVKMAAALCQFFIQDFSNEARQIMVTSLENGKPCATKEYIEGLTPENCTHVNKPGMPADSWAAAQCLALDGNHSYPVIQRLLVQLFEENSEETEKQTLFLLSLLSERTKMVHSMLEEALNSSNWKDRLMGCKALACLHGDISWDLRNNLNYLMWNDWSPAVRLASAKALGKLGLGKEVHDQIRRHLEDDSWKLKVEALSLIGWLQIMTASLFSGFLQCFSDDFSAVRRQACKTAGLLQIKDDMVMERLYHIIQNEPVWKIQAQAIKAVGQIGYVTPRVKEMLLWAVRLEESGVRIEAYNCIAKLCLCDSDVQYALQDKLSLETHGAASRELKRTLGALNIELCENQKMISLIKQKMSDLCQREILVPKILNLNKDIEKGQQELEELLRNTPDWRNKILEPLFFCSIVNKAFLDKSCPSATSLFDSELQEPQGTKSSKKSPQTVTKLQVTSEVCSDPSGQRQRMKMLQSNLRLSPRIIIANSTA